MEKTRLRIRFTKCGDLRWIGHRDLARLWERLLRRANLQLAFSQGFHPKPRINFPSALALGIEATDEIVELEVIGEVSLAEVEQSIRREMPAGMELLHLESPHYSLGKARVVGATYQVELPPKRHSQVEAKIAELLSWEVLEISRDQKRLACNTSDPNFELRIEEGRLIFSLPSLSGGSIRPSELLEQLGLAEWLAEGANLRRTAVHLTSPDPEPVPTTNTHQQT